MKKSDTVGKVRGGHRRFGALSFKRHETQIIRIIRTLNRSNVKRYEHAQHVKCLVLVHHMKRALSAMNMHNM